MAPFERKHALATYHKPFTGGRHSDYRPDYDDMALEFMALGYSLTAFAGSIRVSRNTVYEWMKRHGTFADAVSRGNAARQMAWETNLIQSDTGGKTSAAVFALKNVAPDDWQEVRNVKHDHTVKVETLTDAQLYAIAATKARDGDTVLEGEFTRD